MLEYPSVGTAGLIALLGYGVVFFGLVLLMVVIILLGKAMKTAKKPAAQKIAPGQEPTANKVIPGQEPVPEEPTAIGSAGQVALHDVPDREAAMIMAIVAEKLGKPLHELRFISIKEVSKP